MEHFYPCYPYVICQRFGDNATGAYHRDGLDGHTSEDLGGKFGQEIRAGIFGFVYSVLNKNNPDPSKYRAVYILEEGDNGFTDCMEVSFGHLKDIFINTGDYVTPETVIGTMGNFGEVYADGREVTKEEKLNGSTAGTHLHGPQCRPVKRVKNANPTSYYLRTENGIYNHDGYIFEVPLFTNGYNGCVNPKRYWNGLYAKDYQPIKKAVELSTEAVAIATKLEPEKQYTILEAIKNFLYTIFKGQN